MMSNTHGKTWVECPNLKGSFFEPTPVVGRTHDFIGGVVADADLLGVVVGVEKVVVDLEEEEEDAEVPLTFHVQCVDFTVKRQVSMGDVVKLRKGM